MKFLLSIILILFFLSENSFAQLPKTQCVSTAVASGTGDAIQIPLLPCSATTTMLLLTFSASNTTTTPTISQNGQTPYPILNFDGTSVAVGLLSNGQRRALTFNGTNWFLLTGGVGTAVTCTAATSSGIGCVKPDNVTITVASGGVISAVAASNPTCAQLPAGGCPFDIAMFWPGVAPSAQIIRLAITRAVTCPVAFTGSLAVSREAAAATPVVTVNQITSGTSTARGTFTWSASGTNGIPASSGGITFAAGDLVEFLFPSTADSTLGDIAITLKCSRV